MKKRIRVCIDQKRRITALEGKIGRFNKVNSIFLVFIVIVSANSDLPAGDLTHTDLSKNAFIHPGPNVKGETLIQFGEGNSFFKIGWPEAPAFTEDRDGLGPTFNAISCTSCHQLAGRGVGYHAPTSHTEFSVNVSLLFRLSNAENYGEQLNPLGISGVPGEALPKVFLRMIDGKYDDGDSYQLRVPEFRFTDLRFGALPTNTRVSPRVATQMIGLGLIEAIDEKNILQREDINDTDGDGISGKANLVYDIAAAANRLGRFGWKASQPTLRQQNAAAFLGDLGLTTSLFPNENCTTAQLLCLQAPSGGSPEINETILDGLTIYTQTIGVPARRDSNNPSVLRGEQSFKQIHCTQCHIPTFRTGSQHDVSFLHNQTIYPYSDFLLHDMGPELADHRLDGQPDSQINGREWRTQPLWGVGLIPTVNGHQNLLHDARARSVEEAILWHGGEAEAAKIKFKKLNKQSRIDVVAFINSL